MIARRPAPAVTGRPGPPRLRLTARAIWLTAGAVGAAAVMLLAFLAAGSLGLVVAADVAAVSALLITLGTAPRTAGAPRAPGNRRGRAGGRGRGIARMRAPARVLPARVRERLGAGGTGPSPVDADDFPGFRKISGDLRWATVSQRHYDHAARRLLIRLLDSELGQRWGTDPARDAGAARRLVGEDVWPFLDPSRPPCMDSGAPGVGLATLSRIVGRLEQQAGAGRGTGAAPATGTISDGDATWKEPS